MADRNHWGLDDRPRDRGWPLAGSRADASIMDHAYQPTHGLPRGLAGFSGRPIGNLVGCSPPRRTVGGRLAPVPSTWPPPTSPSKSCVPIMPGKRVAHATQPRRRSEPWLLRDRITSTRGAETIPGSNSKNGPSADRWCRTRRVVNRARVQAIHKVVQHLGSMNSGCLESERQTAFLPFQYAIPRGGLALNTHVSRRVPTEPQDSPDLQPPAWEGPSLRGG
jgi:hypothetical protein